MPFSGSSGRRPLIHCSEYTGSLPRSQAYVSQFRSYRELDRSPWRPGPPILTRSLNLDFSMSGHTRDTGQLLAFKAKLQKIHKG
jgi:hypothetical protein